MVKLVGNAFLALCIAFPGASYSWDLSKYRTAYKSSNYSEAFQLAADGARAGNAEAQFFLGLMYQTGLGTRVDIERAAHWYEKSAHGGDLAGQRYIGKMYYTGQGVMKNYRSAYYWFSKSADRGDAESQYYIGQMNLRGEAVNKNLVEAYFWYLLASTAGFPDAAVKLALVKRDISTAQVNAAQKRAKNWRPSR